MQTNAFTVSTESNGPHTPAIQLSSEKRSIHCTSFSAMFNPLHHSTNQELFEKHIYNRQFLLCKGSHHMLLPNQNFSLSAKMNGTQRSPWRMHCICTVVCCKAPLELNREKIKPIALAIIELCLHQAVSQKKILKIKIP